ncbi:recombinase family protein, partial [Klebsiella pneumoniae]
MDSVHHIWCPLSSQEFQDLPDGAETTLTISVKRMKIGYARKSTHLQDVAHQVDELTKAGCEQIYQDQTSRSGPKRDKKGAPELENCLKALREGDTLVVWALDRLGGSLGQVITLLDDLKKRGITFIAIKDRIDTNAPVIGEIYT